MLRNILKKFVLVVLELAIVAGALLYIAQKRGYKNIGQIVPTAEQAMTGTNQTPFPQLANPVQKTYAWQYKGVNYSLSETLYGSVDDYYAAQPKEYSYVGTAPTNWEEQYYAMFLKSNASDLTIVNLAKDIAAQGKKHNLTDDQIAELALAFVQTLPYDDAKAKQILAGDQSVTMEYPYETLFNDSGVCSDKSFLATALLRSLGYGTALFTYDQQNHMAIGIQCPKQDSTYGSGYCYAETTATGNKIGIIPSLDPTTNKASALIAAQNFDTQQQDATKQLGEVKIYDESTGASYGAIANTVTEQQQLDNLQKDIKNIAGDLASKKSHINADGNALESLKSNLEALKNSGNYQKYNAQVNGYNDQVKSYQNEISVYNNEVSLYNQKVKSYNALLQD